LCSHSRTSQRVLYGMNVNSRILKIQSIPPTNLGYKKFLDNNVKETLAVRVCVPKRICVCVTVAMVESNNNNKFPNILC
jgi:hypothetical protein